MFLDDQITYISSHINYITFCEEKFDVRRKFVMKKSDALQIIVLSIAAIGAIANFILTFLVAVGKI